MTLVLLVKQTHFEKVPILNYEAALLFCNKLFGYTIDCVIQWKSQFSRVERCWCSESIQLTFKPGKILLLTEKIPSNLLYFEM